MALKRVADVYVARILFYNQILTTEFIKNHVVDHGGGCEQKNSYIEINVDMNNRCLLYQFLQCKKDFLN